jgi:hypothetical protein
VAIGYLLIISHKEPIDLTYANKFNNVQPADKLLVDFNESSKGSYSIELQIEREQIIDTEFFLAVIDHFGDLLELLGRLGIFADIFCDLLG